MHIMYGAINLSELYFMHTLVYPEGMTLLSLAVRFLDLTFGILLQ